MSNDYKSVVSFRELYHGLRKCSRNVKWKDSVASYYANRLKNTYKLKQSLENGKYKIDEYQKFKIYEPKQREIVATRIKDRQFQRSLCDNIIYPDMTRSFIRDNVACQRGKGVDDALDRMDTHLHRYYRKYGENGWVLKCDIHHYFPETPHNVAKDAIRKRVNDVRAVERACEIIDSFGNEKGIGLGSQVSQLVELAVLDDIDHYIKEKLHVRHYIRYMDDFILISNDKEFLNDCLVLIRTKLEEIGLELNSKTHIHPLKQGIVFLKWRFILTDTGKVVRKMSRQSIKREKRRLKKLHEKFIGGSEKITMTDISNNYQSWTANANRGNTRGVITKMGEYYDSLFGGIENGCKNQ